MKKIMILAAICFSAVASSAQTKSNAINDHDYTFAMTEQVAIAGNTQSAPINPDYSVPIELNGTATCFCVVSYNDLTGKTGRSGVCLDLTSNVGTTYSGPDPMKQQNRKDCERKCSDAAGALTPAQKQAIADCACSNGQSSGTPIRAFSAVGTRKYQSDQNLGLLINKPEVKQTTCTCPKGWASNTSNQDGGVTTDGRCKKVVCGPIAINPLPTDGTQIGSWGFTWGNEIWAYGTKPNGGAANCVTIIISPKECRLQ